MKNKIRDMSYEGVIRLFSKMLLYQYAQYPLIFIALGYFLMNKFPNNELVMEIRNAGIELNNELVSKIIVLPNEIGAYMFFIILAYGYGFASLFLQARSFKSVILSPIIFIIKMVFVLSAMFYVFYAFVIQTALLVIVGFVFGIISIVKVIRKRFDISNQSIEDDSSVFVENNEQMHYKS